MATNATRSMQEPLIKDGRYMKCPRCREINDILKYVPMGQIEEFLSETNPIYKCPKCRWIFSPARNVVEDFLSDGQ